MKKKQSKLKNYKLDLHHLDTSRATDFEQNLILKLDQFLAPLLIQKNIRIEIVVGKGLGSKKFIDGKSPTKFFTERYLTKLGLVESMIQNSDFNDGVIICAW
jgi:hypothetical protein